MAFAIESQWRLFRDRLRDRRFWIVQALVFGISLIHTALEARGALHNTPEYLLPISTYFIPVLYAALSFGLEGAAPTALWCVLLSIPNVYLFHHGAERIGVATQLTLLVVMGTVVALKVDRERRAKLAAQAANRRLADIQKSLESYIGMAMTAQEEERHRLARELHDETIQDLALVKTALEEIPQGSDERPLQLINDALQRSIDGIRRFCRALRPSVLDDLGLVPALEWLLSDLGSRGGSCTRLKVHGETIRLEPGPELAIFRIAQEALHNVERHARADHVEVRLAFAPGGVCLEVVDDGRGFEPGPVREGSLGLAGMHERARLIGATIRVSSRPGSTRVTLEVPTGRQPAVALAGASSKQTGDLLTNMHASAHARVAVPRMWGAIGAAV